jgi:acyl-CoA reductase-like NAD-dependent aldehyde dehydrogenase
MEVMRNEIFGPLLPIITYDDIDEVIAFVNDRLQLLALDMMSNDPKNINKDYPKPIVGEFVLTIP